VALGAQYGRYGGGIHTARHGYGNGATVIHEFVHSISIVLRTCSIMSGKRS
jgi:hypothetical protein